MVTRRALDVGVNENAVELGGGRWSGRRGGAYEVNKRQEGVGGGWVPGRSMGHMAAESGGGPQPAAAGGTRPTPAQEQWQRDGVRCGRC
jgi:hypothetical protein